MVLLGWVTDQMALKTVLPGFVSMKANSALCFSLAGLSLGLAGQSGASVTLRRLQTACALLVAAIGGLTLGEYFFGLDAGIDQLLFMAPMETTSNAPPGRMAVATALAFVLSGMALTALGLARWQMAAQLAALMASLIGVLAMLGYAFDVRTLYGVFAYSSVALHTAVGFVVLNLGLLCVRPREGLMDVVSSQGDSGVLVRRLLPVALVAPFLIGWLRVFAERQGMISSEFGVALVSVVYITLFSVLIWRAAAVLHQSERKRQSAERAEREKQAQLSGLVDTAMDAIIMVDAQHRITLFNAAAEAMYGYGADEMQGQPLDRLLPARHRGDHTEKIGRFGATGLSSRRMGGLGAVSGVRADGTEFNVEASISQVHIDGALFYTVILRDVTENVRVKHSLQESEARFRSLADAAPVMIWLADPDQCRTWFNHTWLRFTGRLPEQDLGRGWVELVDPEDLPHYLTVYRAAFAQQQPFEMEYRLLQAGGAYTWVLGRGVPRLGPGGEFLGFIGCCTDISLQKTAEQNLNEARRSAEEASSAKSSFLANMSHEIRTPMNAIFGMTQLCLRTGPSNQQRNYLNKITLATDSLLHIIDDILDLSKIEAGRLEISAEPFRLRGVFDSVVSMLGDRIFAKSLALDMPVLPPAESTLLGDAQRLGQVLVNLVANAIKFTERGRIAVSVQEKALEDGVVELHFSVKDQGIGLSVQEQARLFQAFSQADASTTRRYGGTGLGLAICKRLVEMMGGSLWVDSAPGQGSTFHFTARVALSTRPMPRATDLRALDMGALGNLRGALVLLVEDNELNQEVVCDLLAQAGIQVRVAANGQEAITAIQLQTPDCVLMDCQMPVMDGFEATRLLRAMPEYQLLPIVALTANVMTHDRELCLQAGMNDFLSKPININDLFAMLSRWLKGRDTHQEAYADLPGWSVTAHAARSVVPAVSALQLPGFDVKQGLSFAGGKTTLYLKWLKKFRDQHAPRFAPLFEAARANADWATLLRMAHTLKGQAASLGANALAELAGQLEQACSTHAVQASQDLELKVCAEIQRLMPGLAELDALDASMAG
jgi:PAS domain S-box-containing protein